jgi:hypothetical protein
MLNNFRKNIAPHILNLLKSYRNDLNNENCINLWRQYIDDSLGLRKHVEFMSIYTDEVNY